MMNTGKPGYELRMPIAFDRMLTSILPALTRRGYVPNGIRTRVLALKGPRPGPLDDGDLDGERPNT
jgi:hypothetical protein